MTLSRRTILSATAAATTMPLARHLPAQPGAAPPPYSDSAITDRWIVQWMQTPQAVSGALHLGRFADRYYWLTKPINWSPEPSQTASKVKVPTGFVTDFASIPRAFWVALPPDGLYTYPAILHDYLYWQQSVSREEADLVLKYAMEEFKVDAATVAAVYSGVRVGGSAAWNGNAKLKAIGERRILKVYPTDPVIRWDEWKRRPDVF